MAAGQSVVLRSDAQSCPIVVTKTKLEAASSLYAGLSGWRTAATLLDDLREAYPSNHDYKTVLLKASVLNQLYATNVFAIYDMAQHICEVMSTYPPLDGSLVPRIARAEFGGKVRRFVSFASKYAHFFIDSGVFPILDYYAARALAAHLGEPQARAEEWRRDYPLFCAQVDRLRQRDGIGASLRELDQYLWLYGCWMDRAAGYLNKEMAALFDRRLAEIQLAFGV